MKKDVSVSVESSSYDLGQNVRAFVSAVKLALADGFQLGSDLPPILTAAYSNLLSQTVNIHKLPMDAAEDRVAFVRGFTESAFDMAKDLGV